MPIAWQGIDPLIRKDLNTLESLEHPVFITGSRFFGDWSKTSDYDFFIQYDKRVESALLNAGFVKNDVPNMNRYMGDPSLVKLLGGPSGSVHVQLVEDAVKKNRVQHILRTAKFLPYRPDSSMKRPQRKSQERDIWSYAWLLVDVGKK